MFFGFVEILKRIKIRDFIFLERNENQQVHNKSIKKSMFSCPSKIFYLFAQTKKD